MTATRGVEQPGPWDTDCASYAAMTNGHVRASHAEGQARARLAQVHRQTRQELDPAKVAKAHSSPFHHQLAGRLAVHSSPVSRSKITVSWLRLTRRARQPASRIARPT